LTPPPEEAQPEQPLFWLTVVTDWVLPFSFLQRKESSSFGFAGTLHQGQEPIRHR
jgi:hypothetical protein